jgi:hypothetical protein
MDPLWRLQSIEDTRKLRIGNNIIGNLVRSVHFHTFVICWDEVALSTVRESIWKNVGDTAVTKRSRSQGTAFIKRLYPMIQLVRFVLPLLTSRAGDTLKDTISVYLH